MFPNLGYSVRNCLHVFLAFSLLLLLIINGFDSVAYGVPADAYLFITPSMYVAKEIGELFDIAINISNVEDLRSLKFTVTYNTSLLDVTQVIQGLFFPSPPEVCFEFEKNESLGFVMVNVSLADSEASRSGNGTLAWIGFKVVQGPESCVSSPLDLEQTLLLNSALNPIAHDLVGAVYFWKSMQPDPPPGGRLLDLYTQKGGKGPDEPGGEFVAGEMVYLISRVTYNDYPVQQKLVAFEARSALNETMVILVTATDQDGFAQMSFRIPNIPSSNRTWTGISVVDIAGETVWDTISFRVLSLSASISPLSASILVGQSVTFTSTVSGGYAPYSYQWYLDGAPVSGATSSSWTFALQPIGNYSVYLNVTDSLGNMVKSNQASVTVASQLTVSISPMSASILVGQSVTFTSTVSGGYTPYSYQWYLNGNPVSGATSASWTFTTTTSGIYYIYLKVTDAKGNTVQSDTARITVATVPVGGYSFPIQVTTKTEPIIPYIALIATLTAIFTKLRPKTRRRR